MSATTHSKRKVVILGGGAGALSAAMALSGEGWRDRFESITVYQLGFRLGGKGASGRGVHDRIEEHGLHVWLGWYENAFRVLGDCYEELGGHGPFTTLADAFDACNTFVAMEDRPDGWVPWVGEFAANERVPWGRGLPPLPSLWEYVVSALELAFDYLAAARRHRTIADASPGLTVGAGPLAADGLVLGPKPVSLRAAFSNALPSIASLWKDVIATMATAEDLLLIGAIEMCAMLETDPSRHDPAHHEQISGSVEGVLEAIHRRLEAEVEPDDEARRLLYLAEVLLACVKGVLSEGLVFHEKELYALDAYDFVDWLVAQGASKEAAGCAIIKTIVYDMPFAYEAGEPDRPRCSAATALQGLWRLFFTYHGAIAWKMRAGMGDVVFAPLYRCLKARGVKFEFFHRVDALRLSDDHTRIDAIELHRQVDLRDPSAGYEPLVDVLGLPSWPAEPDVSQLKRGKHPTAHDLESFWSTWKDAEKVTLRDGEEFDLVVLGISLGAHRYVCSDLIDADPAWAAMSGNVQTVQTQAAQLWLTESFDELGADWRTAIIGGYLEPFDTIADMPQIIERETWPSPVGAIAYMCNTMPTPAEPPPRTETDYPAQQTGVVKQNTLRFLAHDLLPVWPRAVHRYPMELRWEILLDPEGRSGRDRFDGQYWRANVNPSDRYVLSLPGTARFRLTPGESGFDNLFLAGDWTFCSVNAGCVEAAVTSGLLCANAIVGTPRLEEIRGHGQ
jgi:uncharacterized protein with NAD-binding domain and iron-sulfur cluster